MKRKSWALLLAASAVPIVSGCASSGGESLWARSVSAMPWSNRNDSKAAVVADPQSEDDLSPEFKAARKTFKDAEHTMLAWARYQEDIGEFASARQKYRELLVVYPDCSEASIGLARIELQTGRSQQAEDILTQLEQRAPTDPQVKLALGRLYANLERFPEAIAVFERAVELDAASQESRYELGLALARTHQFDPALAHLTYAVGESAANYNIGYILHDEGRDADAVEWFRNAMALHPDDLTASKSRTMLAQLAPAQEQESAAAASAQLAALRARRPQPQMPTADYSDQNEGVAEANSAVLNQFVPQQHRVADSGTRQHQLAMEPTHRSAAAEVMLPPVADEQSVSLPAVNPVRNVSMSQPAGTERGASAGTASLPNWNGPRTSANQPLPNQSGARGAVEPPPWRSRQ